jgi:TRAP-type C4-dicarboxylate transport system permease small subunit
MSIDIAVAIFFRYIVNRSLAFPDEVALFSMIWLVFLGSSVLMSNWEHIRISVLRMWMPRLMQISLAFLDKILILILLLFIIYHGFIIVHSGFNQLSIGLGISTKWVKLSIPVGGILMVLNLIVLMINDLIQLWRKNFEYFILKDVEEGEDV